MLQIRGLAVTYHGTITAIQDVSLEAPDRGVVALLGANGAGKSTILRAITGLLGLHGGRIVSGSITFDGQRIDTLDATQIVRRGIAQVLEGRRLFAELTVDENLRAGALANPDPASIRRAYTRVMDLFPALAERRHSVSGFLSGGQQQMLAIGRGLMANPRLLLLDEPAAGLTAPDIAELAAIIDRIRAEGITIVLIEHHMDVVMKLCDRVSVLDFGVRIAEGTPGDIRRDPAVRAAYLGEADVA